MAQKITFKLKRCTQATRTSYTPTESELLHETDTNKIYIGDGTTAGGNLITGSGSGEANTASNQGTGGVGVFSAKSALDLQFKNIIAKSNKVVVTDNPANKEIEIDIVEANLTTLIEKSNIDAKGDLLVGSADDTVSVLSTPSLSAGDGDRVLTVEDGDDETVLWKKKMDNTADLNYVSTSTYTIDYETDHIIVGVATSDMTFTFPNPTHFPTTGRGKKFYFKNATTDKIVTVKLYGTGTFQNGLNQIKLRPRETLSMGMVRPNVADGAFLLQNVYAHAQVRRSTSWDDNNFSNATAVPFDTNDHIHNSDIIDHNTTTNNTRVNLKVKSEYKVAFKFSIDSTGGGTWSLSGYLRKNGTTQIAGSSFRTGNYGGEDGFVSMPHILVDVTSSTDYVELILDHSNLTGHVDDVVIMAETKA